VLPVNGAPEELVTTEAEARNVVVEAEASGSGANILRAELLAAKLNAIKFPGFADAESPSGQSVGELIALADQILNDLATGTSHTQFEVISLAELLDAANNNGEHQVLFIGEGCATPTPTRTPTGVLPVAGGPTPSPIAGPGSLPPTGDDPTGPGGLSGFLAVLTAVALVGGGGWLIRAALTPPSRRRR